MPEAASTEFWRHLQPIRNSLKPDAQPEVYLPQVATDDDRYYVPFTETVGSRPLWINVKDNSWADILRAKEAGLVNRHYHPHEVFAYTISGKWGYLERPWTARAGDFVYESPGEGHTLVAYESDEPMKAFFIVKGPLVWLDENGAAEGYFDVHDYIALCRAHYEKNGIGADYVDSLFR
ncbi:2,4'-dihydroxyacetophenone dioxygenase family protein [Streptomyces sp. CA-249302]|uniref:2,4'-dihydroxyacetophenone dioxygenase family protein n=1 Tax=Streptomyces sp. CA-249302 TaxID=3240058 RepID=UPI003D8EB46C